MGVREHRQGLQEWEGLSCPSIRLTRPFVLRLRRTSKMLTPSSWFSVTLGFEGRPEARGRIRCGQEHPTWTGAAAAAPTRATTYKVPPATERQGETRAGQVHATRRLLSIHRKFK